MSNLIQLVHTELVQFVNQYANNGVMYRTLADYCRVPQNMQKLTQNTNAVAVMFQATQLQMAQSGSYIREAVKISAGVQAATLVSQNPNLLYQMSPQEQADYNAMLNTRAQLDRDLMNFEQRLQQAPNGYVPPVHARPSEPMSTYFPQQQYQPQVVVPNHIPVSGSYQPQQVSLATSAIHTPVQTHTTVSAPMASTATPVEVLVSRKVYPAGCPASLVFQALDGVVKTSTVVDGVCIERIEEDPTVRLEDHLFTGLVTPTTIDVGDVLGGQNFWDFIVDVPRSSAKATDSPLYQATDSVELFERLEPIYAPGVLAALTPATLMRQERIAKGGEAYQNGVGYFTVISHQLVCAFDSDANMSDDQKLEYKLFSDYEQGLKGFFDYGTHLNELSVDALLELLTPALSCAKSEIVRLLAGDLNTRLTRMYNTYRQYSVGDQSFEMTSFSADYEPANERLRSFAKERFGPNWNSLVGIPAHMKQLIKRACNYCHVSAEELEKAPYLRQLTVDHNSEFVTRSIWRREVSLVAQIPMLSAQLGILMEEAIGAVTRESFPALHSFLGTLVEKGVTSKYGHTRRFFTTQDNQIFELIALNKDADGSTTYVIRYSATEL